MIKFALTCKTFTSRSNSKKQLNRYENNCLCVKNPNDKLTARNEFNISILLIRSQNLNAEVVDHIIKSTQQGKFLFHLDIVLNIF